MATYTQTDLTTITQAIIDLGAGKRMVRCTIAGETMEYAPANLAELRALRSEIQAELAAASDGASGYCLISSSKGY